MNYNGFTWFFKARAAQSVQDILEQLEDKNCKKLEAWELHVKHFSNEKEQYGTNKKTSVVTVCDSLSELGIAVLKTKQVKETKDKRDPKERLEFFENAPKVFEFRDNIDPLLKNLDLDLVESVNVKGHRVVLSDLDFCFGVLTKDKTLQKELFLRVELKSMLANGQLNLKRYRQIGAEVLALLGPDLEKAFSNPDLAARVEAYFESLKPQSHQGKVFMYFENAVLAQLLADLLLTAR